MSKFVKTKYYAETILRKLRAQYRSKELCDVRIFAGTEKVKNPPNRINLAATSDYFKEMLSSKWNENKLSQVLMSSASSLALRSIIQHFYTGCMEINEYKFVELLKEADMTTRLNEVVKFSEEFLLAKLDPLNCIHFALIAELFNYQNLLEAAKHLSLNHFVDFCGTDDFLNLSVEILKNILSNNNLGVWPEIIVFIYVMKWIEHDLTERVKFKPELLKLVRLPLFEAQFLYEKVKPMCNQVYLEALKLKFSSDCSVKYSYDPQLQFAINLSIVMKIALRNMTLKEKSG